MEGRGILNQSLKKSLYSKEEADKLTDYTIDAHYPEESFEPTLEEAKEVF